MLARLSKQLESYLSRVCNSHIEIDRLDVLTAAKRRNRIIRIYLKNTKDGFPQSLIVKQAAGKNHNPKDNSSQDTINQFNDWAGAEFLSGFFKADGERITPEFYGGNHDLGYIMADLGTLKSIITYNGEDVEIDSNLVGPLFGESAKNAKASLLAWIECIAQMHTLSIGREKDYEKVRNRLGRCDKNSRVIRADWFRDHIEVIRKVCHDIEFKPEVYFYDELQTLLTTIENPGPLLAYTHGDPCPNNCVISAGKIYLIDFERGGYQHALFDAIYPRIAFPSCGWCRTLPESIVHDLELAYRTQLINGCPQAADEAIFQRGIVDACAFWTMMVFRSLPKVMQEDQDWGIATLRQRCLARLEIMAAVDNEYNHLPALTVTSAKLASRLRQLWPETVSLSHYPAFIDRP